MSNSLTRNAGLKLGPIFLETFVKHYFDKLVKDGKEEGVPLRKEELLYDEVFHIVKKFLAQASAKHTVEELQSFSNTRTPSPPWVHVVRLVVPMSSCEEAATYLIKAFGGEAMTKDTIGGTRWWQVRGIRGVNAEWITAKKDHEEARRRNQEQRQGRSTYTRKKQTTIPPMGSTRNNSVFEQEPATEENSNQASIDPENAGTYPSEMDGSKCILYSHGGGYYFGSVDQERYSVQRLARKIKGRVFAVNYRLAPQYPFPCAIQDLLACYLFLIRPPKGSAHSPVLPEDIIVAGDSAGGGLTLALLQVIRDSDLPPPAGGILISPWCDFTHSFPSIFTNTDTDVIPETGLSLHKPSSLWPPPPDEMTHNVREGLRKTIRQTFHRTPKVHEASSPEISHSSAAANLTAETDPIQRSASAVMGASAVSLPPPKAGAEQLVVVDRQDGQGIRIASQLQLYAPNGLLTHPLVSPALSYLGGLPPLLFIASDKEVLRDEIVFAAHRAAHPERYPIRVDVQEAYPVFKGLDVAHMVPTPVHLQVYDDAAHVLPVLFPFTSPAKYCFRAMATFCKHITALSSVSLPSIEVPTLTSSPPSSPMVEHPPTLEAANIDDHLREPSSLSTVSNAPHSTLSPATPSASDDQYLHPLPSSSALSSSSDSDIMQPEKAANLRRSWTSALPRVKSLNLLRRSTLAASHSGSSTSATSRPSKAPSEDVAGPRVKHSSAHEAGSLLAGEASVYSGDWPKMLPPIMIRERVSTQGVIRPLEPESELSAFKVPVENIGVMPEAAVARYIVGKEKLEKKYASTIKQIAKQRARTLERAKQDTVQHMSRLQHYLDRQAEEEDSKQARTGDNRHTLKQGLLESTASWNLAWALDADERPPPSSIVARRDTEEAIKLARVADQAIFATESSLNANNLWGLVLNFLTFTPDKQEGQRAGRQHLVGREKRRKRDRVVQFWKEKTGPTSVKTAAEANIAAEGIAAHGA